MHSALIVHSRHTKKEAKRISKKYRNVKFLKIIRTPTENTLKLESNRDVVIGIGGGSVIDTAKIIANPKRCIAIPTTASGASMTPYATIWGKNKRSIKCPIPITKKYKEKINLPYRVVLSTMSDALSHAVESYWSKNATVKSKKYSIKAIKLLAKYAKKLDTKILVNAGNYAGKAIAIAKTNIIHATSYVFTIEYGIEHGLACGILLPFFAEYIDHPKLYKIFGYSSNNQLVDYLKVPFLFFLVDIPTMDIKKIVNLAMTYNKLNDSIKFINKKILSKIIKKIIEEYK